MVNQRQFQGWTFLLLQTPLLSKMDQGQLSVPTKRRFVSKSLRPGCCTRRCVCAIITTSARKCLVVTMRALAEQQSTLTWLMGAAREVAMGAKLTDYNNKLSTSSGRGIRQVAQKGGVVY